MTVQIFRKLWQGNHIWKSPFLKCFSRKNLWIFKFLRFEERLRKTPFSWRISVDGRPNSRNEAAFSKFSGAVRTCFVFRTYQAELIFVNFLPRWKSVESILSKLTDRETFGFVFTQRIFNVFNEGRTPPVLRKTLHFYFLFQIISIVNANESVSL